MIDNGEDDKLYSDAEAMNISANFYEALNGLNLDSRDFISKKISIDMEAVEATVYGDVKWLEFILNQVIGNSIKYMA